MTRLLPIRLDCILAAEAELQPLMTKARELGVLAGLVQSFLSAEPACEARVASFKDGKLVLLASNPPAAAKLRLLAPALARFLLERRWQVNLVSVRVQPMRSPGAALSPRKHVHLSTHALSSLCALYARLAPSPAREVLARLLRRHGRLADD